MRRRVAITGDRYWTDEAALRAALATLDPLTDFVVLGDCPKGADKIAWSVVEKLRLSYSRHRAHWDTYHGGAGPRRNGEMLDALTTGDEGELVPTWTREVWYFHDDLPNSRGTKDCVEQARDRGITVRDGRTVT